jgi:4-diphosphocytidyl-2-C-methyl-D-erythritol kinase
VGRGSEVYPLPDLPEWAAVLLVGAQPIPTSEVYRMLAASPMDSATQPALYEWVVAGGVLPLSLCRNDLEPAVVRRWPEVAQRLAALSSTAPMLAMLSGSGSTVFGLYPGIREAEQAAESLAAAHDPLVVPLLPRAQAVLRPSAEEEPWISPRSAST